MEETDTQATLGGRQKLAAWAPLTAGLWARGMTCILMSLKEDGSISTFLVPRNTSRRREAVGYGDGLIQILTPIDECSRNQSYQPTLTEGLVVSGRTASDSLLSRCSTVLAALILFIRCDPFPLSRSDRPLIRTSFFVPRVKRHHSA